LKVPAELNLLSIFYLKTQLNMISKQLLVKKLRTAVFVAAMFLGASAAFAQVKIGTNPTTIDPANNLEVESTAGNKVSVNKTTGKVTIADGSQGSGKILTSDANGVATWQTSTPSSTVFFGTVDAGDINQFNTSPSIPVSGYITSASRYSNTTGVNLFSIITVSFPSLGTTNYAANVTLESITGLGGGGYNVSLVMPPVISAKTPTGFTVYLREVAEVGQDIRLNITLVK
jgi:hypothetical protein